MKSSISELLIPPHHGVPCLHSTNMLSFMNVAQVFQLSSFSQFESRTIIYVHLINTALPPPPPCRTNAFHHTIVLSGRSIMDPRYSSVYEGLRRQQDVGDLPPPYSQTGEETTPLNQPKSLKMTMARCGGLPLTTQEEHPATRRTVPVESPDEAMSNLRRQAELQQNTELLEVCKKDLERVFWPGALREMRLRGPPT